MKITKTLKAALLALAGIALGNPSAGAALVDDWVNGDLILGVRASGGTGSSDSYLVNLGSRTQFTSSTAGFALSLGNIGLDLVSKYGSNWYERNDLYWGVFGTVSGASPTVYASRARLSIGTQSTPWPVLSVLTDRSATDSEIVSVTTAFNLLDATANSARGAFQANASSAASYNYQVTRDGTDFGSTSQWGTIEGSFANGTAGTALDLYAINGSTTTYRGVFGIDNTGTVSFNVVPEPSTTSLAALAGAFFIGSRRRRKTA